MTIGINPTLWKEDWEEGRASISRWWSHEGLALCVTAPAELPHEDIKPPEQAPTLEHRWLNPEHRISSSLFHLSKVWFGGAAFPICNVDIGPGSLGLFLDGIGHLAEDTVWYEPTLSDPDAAPSLCHINTSGIWWERHIALIKQAQRYAAGRFVIGMPDLIENLDVLAQLRNPQTILMDIIERPEWCLEKIEEINTAWFEAFDQIYSMIETPWGGNATGAFSIWGPGRTAKLQCDISCAISPTMYRKFVIPALTKQCRKLDFSMYHLDGTQALPQLNNLLAIEELDAIEWTPQSGIEGGGSPRWFDLYRAIKAGGKSVQAIQVKPTEVLPLIDAVGPEGMFIMCEAMDEKQGRDLLARTQSM